MYYEIPIMYEILDKLGRCTIDLKQGIHQIEIPMT